MSPQFSIAILPEALAQDPGRLARFTREAQVLAYRLTIRISPPFNCTVIDFCYTAVDSPGLVAW